MQALWYILAVGLLSFVTKTEGEEVGKIIKRLRQDLDEEELREQLYKLLDALKSNENDTIARILDDNLLLRLGTKWYTSHSKSGVSEVNDDFIAEIFSIIGATDVKKYARIFYDSVAFRILIDRMTLTAFKADWVEKAFEILVATVNLGRIQRIDLIQNYRLIDALARWVSSDKTFPPDKSLSEPIYSFVMYLLSSEPKLDQKSLESLEPVIKNLMRSGDLPRDKSGVYAFISLIIQAEERTIEGVIRGFRSYIPRIADVFDHNSNAFDAVEILFRHALNRPVKPNYAPEIIADSFVSALWNVVMQDCGHRKDRAISLLTKFIAFNCKYAPSEQILKDIDDEKYDKAHRAAVKSLSKCREEIVDQKNQKEIVTRRKKFNCFPG